MFSTRVSNPQRLSASASSATVSCGRIEERRPDWPSERERADDLSHHVELKRLIDRAADARLTADVEAPTTPNSFGFDASAKFRYPSLGLGCATFERSGGHVRKGDRCRIV
jgi:hypothetical protein